MDQAARIIARFGGVRPMARILSEQTGRRVPPTTVQGWAQRGLIPAARQADVLAAAKARDIALDPEDFFTPPAAPGGPAQSDLPGPELLSVAEMGRADGLTIEAGTPGATLMEAAGGGAAQLIRARFAPGPVAVLCGPGNNGGDGFVIAHLLDEAGWQVRLGFLGDVAKLPEDAALNARRWREAGGEIAALSPDVLGGAGLIVDALFGAGLARPLDGVARATVEAAQASGLPVVAIDMPSGVHGDSGAVLGAAAPAVLTVTFFRKKPGHLLLPGKVLAGEVRVIDIGIPERMLGTIRPQTFENGPQLWADAFPWPGADAHKYSRGHLVIGGGAEMTGAARLAARAGLRIGAGLVTIATAPHAVADYATYLPAVLTTALDRAGDFAAYLDDPRRRAVLLGPGYGVDKKTYGHVLTALALGKRVCLDADALTVFRGRAGELFAAIAANAESGGGAVLTPHEGEFARLFPDLTEGSKLDRAREAARRSGGVVLIKGPDTVIASPDGRAAINANAPPDLATGGSGDVLAGLTAGLLVQEVPPFESAAIAAWIHGRAAAEFGPGLIADDLPDAVPGVLRDLKG